ncbi:sigma-70 family RNA polymerase sigma factor [Corallococcus sicarius]|uniref:Sigma-70 family RNA polymerase sigma factor n=1 Tax=Corallococcus sicarius TaxID=2316726 RepID=A0A3A8MGV3_9BACT|nr:sigma-70 family RNA polymerase sigma factor [Corallococcus sicarius]
MVFRPRSPRAAPRPGESSASVKEATPTSVGDAEEFQALVARCAPALEERARILCRGRSPSDAKDLLQETYERAFRAFHTYDRSAPPMAWLASILVRRFLDWCRHDRRHPHEEFTDTMGDTLAEPEAPSEIWAHYTLEDVWRAVEQLPPELREVVRMKDMERQSYAEIGRRLGIPSMTVGTRLFRARKKLKELLLTRQGSAGVPS